MAIRVINLSMATSAPKPGHRSGYWTEEEVLTRYDDDGWQLVAVDNGKAYLWRNGEDQQVVAPPPRAAASPSTPLAPSGVAVERRPVRRKV